MYKRLLSSIIIMFMTVLSACGGGGTKSGVAPQASTVQVSNESKEQITESEGVERTADISETVYNVALKYVSLTDEYFNLKIELDEYTDKMERLAASLESVTGYQELPNDEIVLDDMDNLLESAKNRNNQDIQLWYSALKVDLGLNEEKKDDGDGIAKSPQDSESEMISKTDNSIAMYTAVLGVESTEDNLSVSQEFVDGISDVYLMGRNGTISHGFTKSASVVDIMDWISNESGLSHDDFLGFVELLNRYFKSDALLRSYDTFSDETYVWTDRTIKCFIFAYYEEGRIAVSWRYAPDYISSSSEVDSEPTSPNVQTENESNAQSFNTESLSPKSKQSKTTFTNGYGTPTTKCAHPGCDEFIAPSGNTNCCIKHSKRCLDCGQYCDEDAMYCLDCIQKAADALK